ncbi:MAG: UDP-N-acetylglucosamine 2-epimerase (non-hydrolyzing) [Candidatus Lokiarchaeota archaeon]|nr:UDP-N-acetylglucosamine 2-epimerase (non-hydrolyzing) [Candidatus Lokiarchaeota archaeon]
MKKIITCIGIRPDIIRLSQIIKSLDLVFENIIVDSGQHYDFNLNKIFYDQLEIRQPQYNLEIRSGTHAEQVGNLMIEFENVLRNEKPEFVIVLGDNNSSLGFALTTSKLNIPLVHIEAGMRSRNWEMPEEKNRVVIDHIADMNICYLNRHKDNLVREGIHPERIWVVGNPIIEVLNNVDPTESMKKDFILVTCHRAENIEKKDNLDEILGFLGKLYQKERLEIKFILMPKTENMMDKFSLKFPEGVNSIPPQGFLEFLGMEKAARLVITDSGTVVEECAILGTPCETIRESTERTDLIELGVNVLTGINMENMMDASKFALSKDIKPVSHYGESIAKKITNILLGNSLAFYNKRKFP